MFTGIVAEIGAIRHTGPNESGLRLEIASSGVSTDLGIDASVNVAGVCLTVVERDTHGFAVDVVAETLSRTTLGRAIRGTRVNLEAAATPTTALGGHFVQGHVDATTKLVGRREEGGGAARWRLATSGTSRRTCSPSTSSGSSKERDRLPRLVGVGIKKVKRMTAKRPRVVAPAGPFASVNEAIDDIRRGKMVIVVDDEDRENEGDLTMAEELTRAEDVAFIRKYASGVICVPMITERLQELDLPQMVSRNEARLGTAFTVSVDAREGVTTGISAADRARTIRVLANPATNAHDL